MCITPGSGAVGLSSCRMAGTARHSGPSLRASCFLSKPRDGGPVATQATAGAGSGARSTPGSGEGERAGHGGGKVISPKEYYGRTAGNQVESCTFPRAGAAAAASSPLRPWRRGFMHQKLSFGSRRPLVRRHVGSELDGFRGVEPTCKRAEARMKCTWSRKWISLGRASKNSTTTICWRSRSLRLMLFCLLIYEMKLFVGVTCSLASSSTVDELSCPDQIQQEQGNNSIR
jgi:hypothetical protein